MQHVLIVEDDDRLAWLIKNFLDQNQFTTSIVSDGAEVIGSIKRQPPDLILMDIMLPNVDGFSLCQSIKLLNKDIPILFLTARDDSLDQILGLEMGADDYIIKPIEPNVLLARIRMIQRRMRQHGEEKTQIIDTGTVRVNSLERKLEVNQQLIKLTSYEFDLFWLLASNAGTVVSRDDIHNAVIGRDFDGIDRSVDVRISRLRKKLQNIAGTSIELVTVWGKGYCIPNLPGETKQTATKPRVDQ